jgi:hypothetical protein
MKMRNYTPLDDAWLRKVIAAVKPANVTNFDISFKNCGYKGHRGRAYTKGCSYHGSWAPLVIVSLGKATYPYKTTSRGAYLGVELYSLAEAAVFITAHELRHLWQGKIKKRWRVWGSKGQYSERDADAYALQMVRRYRRGELDA